jgi:hypothetical protein
LPYSRVNVNLRWFFIQLVIPLFAIVLVIVVLLIVVLAIVVLAIVVPLFCVLGSVASYRRARHRRAMLSLFELVSTFLPSHRCLAC